VNSSKSKPTDEAPPLPDFERSLTELEAIVEKLEQGELSLEESLQQFERGVQLTRTCQAALKEAEQKVEILLRKSGSPEQFDTAEFDPDESERD
jgi:exodeoxyribonuclease VII small subunit